MSKAIYVGQTLYAKNGESVIITDIIDERIRVKYKGKIHERNKSVIGTKLFQTNPIARNNSKNSGIIEYQKEQERITRNIDKYRTNNEDEKKWWPKYGDASAFKFRNYKRYED